MKKEDVYPGLKIGKLTLLQFDHVGKYGRHWWLCKCDCGRTKVVSLTSLFMEENKGTKSCGCLRGQWSVKHHDYLTRLYYIWMTMKQRCENPNNHCYQRYGAKGITVCEEWHKYENFKNWAMSNGYSVNLTIDRIDNNKGYEPSNCRWADRKIQSRNRKHVQLFSFKGEMRTIQEISEITGVSEWTLRRRLKDNWSIEKAVSTPTKRRPVKIIEFNGEAFPQSVWDKKLGLPKGTVGERLRAGWSIERALTTPKLHS